MWLSVARILLLVFCGTDLIVPPTLTPPMYWLILAPTPASQQLEDDRESPIANIDPHDISELPGISKTCPNNSTNHKQHANLIEPHTVS